MLKKLLLHSSIYGLAPQIPQVANILILPIITQDLTSLDYGVAGVVYAYLAALGALHFLGLNIILSNGFYHHSGQYKWLWRQVHGFVSIWSLIYAILIGVVIFWVVPEEASEHRWTITIIHVLPFAFMKVTANYGRLYFRLSTKPIPIAIQVIVVGFVSVGLNLYLISYQGMGYMGWFWSRFVGSVITFLFFAYPIYFKLKMTPIFNFKWRLIKEKLKISLPMVPHAYGGYLLTSSDRVVMDMLQVNVKSIGLYNLAGNFGNYFNAFADGTGMATGPMIYNYFRTLTREEAFKKARNLVFLWQGAFLVLSFLVCLWFKEVFEFLINNDELQAAYPLGIIMIMGYNYRPLYAGFSDKLYYYEKAHSLWKVSFGAGILNVVLNLIFIPLYGIEAAALSTFVSFLFLGTAGFFMKEYYEMKDLNFYPFRWLVLICISSVLVYYLKDIQILYKVGLTAFLILSSVIWAYNNKAFLSSFDLKAP